LGNNENNNPSNNLLQNHLPREPRVSSELSDFISVEATHEMPQLKALASPKHFSSSNHGVHRRPASLVPRPMFHNNVPPLIIFPEGTTSSGRTILPFKRGAFLGLKPVTPVVLIYKYKGISISFDVLSLGWLIPLMLSSIFPVTLEAYWLREVLPPNPLFADNNKNNNKQATDDDRVFEFAADVHSRMSNVLKNRAPFTTDQSPSGSWSGGLRLKQELMKKLKRNKNRKLDSEGFSSSNELS